MAQVFKPSADVWLRAILVTAALTVVSIVVGGWVYLHSDWLTDVGEPPWQPVPFSHRHHAGELEIDCRYCHYTVEQSAQATLPTAETCMTCHSKVWTEADMLRPVREAYAEGRPLVWNRVVDVPDFVYFNHAIHVDKGVGCTTCHGPIQEMALTYESHSYSMAWCLDCHRDPAPYVRPRDALTDLRWKPTEDQIAVNRRRLHAEGVTPETMTDCYTCHR